jgi:hypothetical protein
MMPFLIICAPTIHITGHWRRSEFRIAMINWVGSVGAISRWRVGDLNLERMVRWEILPSNQNRGTRSWGSQLNCLFDGIIQAGFAQNFAKK